MGWVGGGPCCLTDVVIVHTEEGYKSRVLRTGSAIREGLPAVATGSWLAPGRNGGTRAGGAGTHSLLRLSQERADEAGKRVYGRKEPQGSVCPGATRPHWGRSPPRQDVPV